MGADIAPFLVERANLRAKRSRLAEKVIELAFSDRALEEPPTSLREIFGDEAFFRGEASWLKIFLEGGLESTEVRRKLLGLMRRLWDDLREQPSGTLTDLGKTLYSSYIDERAGRMMKLFRRFFKD